MPIINSAEGDLITMLKNGDINIILHQANTQMIMGGGIALNLKKEFPEVYEVDLQYPLPKGLQRLGYYSATKIKSLPEAYVFNMYCQNSLGIKEGEVEPTNYQAVYESFFKLNKVLGQKRFQYLKIAIPKLFGSGLAGADWKIIHALINRATPDIDIIAVEFKPDHASF